MMHWTPERTEAVRLLWVEGMSMGAIGAHFGFSRGAISGLVVRNGWQRGSQKMAPPKKSRQPATLPREIPAPLTEHQVTFLERTAKQCKWIIGEPNGPDSICCGAPRQAGDVYCEHHCRVAYPRGTRRG